MVVYYFNFARSGLRPIEAEAILLVYSDRILAFSTACKRFEPVSRWHFQILKRLSCVELDETSQCGASDGGEVA